MNKKGTKKGDKIHGRKKGKKGEAAAYVTRAQALAKLQLSLADFRKLCILKGIYPRDPKKKAAGLDKTYYHKKDILFLAHEPIMAKFFELKAFMKKFKRLMGRKEYSTAKSFEERKPKYTLHHLVRERYPSFDDAVRDLDDGISMLALFQGLSADQRREIPPEAINEATRLYQEFQLYVIRAQALRKCFASVKGYYFQADVCGHNITWLAPHQFAQDLPNEVDFRVMLTFLEFYRAMTKFVNFKLYSDLGLEYPPKRDAKKDSAEAEVAALEVEMRDAGRAREAAAKQGEEEDAEVANDVVNDFGEQSAEAVEMQKQIAAASRMKTTFRGLKLFINREVPLRPVYFTLLCGGASEVGWERGAAVRGASGSAFNVNSKVITHQIVDRPPDQLEEQKPGREYVQPQWVFDSFNMGCLLPVAPYAPGRTPPPHLSPFVDDKAEGYLPRQREILDRFASEAGGAEAQAPVGETVTPGASDANSGVAKKEQGGFERFTQELQAESAGTLYSDFQEKQRQAAAKRMEQASAEMQDTGSATDGVAGGEDANAAAAAAALGGNGEDELDSKVPPKPSEEEEERLRAKALMPKKHKRLLQRIEKTEKKKQDANETLRKKRRQLEQKGQS